MRAAGHTLESSPVGPPPCDGPCGPVLVEDPAALAAADSPAARHVAAFARAGTPAMIRNAASRVMLLRHGAIDLPVTVDEGSHGGSYVASPHSAYVLYARDEIDIIGMTRGRRGAIGVLGVMDGLLRAMRINRAVHLDNWLLSTNLHGGWDGSGLGAMRAVLAERFADHFLILRSLDPWSCPDLLEAARADGWELLPARQIWVTDDLARDWRPRNNCANDRRALRRSGLLVEEPETLGEADCARIAELYRGLYVERYSSINPVFTPSFIAESAHSGLLSWRLARDAEGTILIAAGIRAVGGIATVPLLGYDTARPQSEGLYRIASYLFSEWAMERGLRLHGSAGAGTFKRNRGARGVIEYMAVDARHLAPARRAALGFFARSLRALMVPLLRRQGW
ncbi:hypothetical protein [Erythrobacter sp. HL-111]|uniref:hypothetical protein n=1 Tax=Erythrobacter sp. HL-111 TaxID=1798193 RepID=UPI0006D9AB18|nr:hypothetical protein [Erythrobacter sp. HL-111]KPP96226.1 MAG: hypothetical protein HLUCCO15_01165 [Erythrobacteraceae bacterium HL-111]SDR77303.1 hypothetical protein SAMN04515621_0325 [Erythrobacter sp. HL-111]